MGITQVDKCNPIIALKHIHKIRIESPKIVKDALTLDKNKAVDIGVGIECSKSELDKEIQGL